MLKRLGMVCAALLIGAAAFSTSVEARSWGHGGGGVRAGGFGGGGARMGGFGGGVRMGAANFGGARIGAGNFGGARMSRAYMGGARIGGARVAGAPVGGRYGIYRSAWRLWRRKALPATPASIMAGDGRAGTEAITGIGATVAIGPGGA